MNFLEIFLTAVGLSMDAFAVSVANGATRRIPGIPAMLKICGAFGLFQAVMPLLGWLAGANFEKYVSSFAHWIVFGILSFIGVKIISDAIKKNDDETCIPENARKSVLSNKMLFTLAVATSIDAFSVGVSFAFIKVQIVQATILIGMVTFIICLGGVEIGRRCLVMFKRRAEILGGVILIVIGLKVLIERI
ncbi:MAG: manganese efflux pump [Clostridiaceae bacterium]|nr:manganese efflux pump [Clostridiaceae bacterium]